MNKFAYTLDNKRYHTLSYHYKSRNLKVQKAIVDIGTTCPNIDGSKSVGGCVYCDGNASYFSRGHHLSVTKQLELEKARINAKWGNIPIIAYFQGGTNTYLPTCELSKYIDEVLSFDDIYGISIATRPDCISDEMLDFLEKLNSKTNLTVELGLQTVHDETAVIINRAYPYEVFKNTFLRLKGRNIRVCVHIINGLPKETKEMMIETAKVIGKLEPDGLKIHLLHLLKGTTLENSTDYTAMEMDDYIDVLIRQLEYIPAETVIERVTGDADKNKLISPLWSKDKIKVLGTIDKTMKEKDTYQGVKFLKEEY